MEGIFLGLMTLEVRFAKIRQIREKIEVKDIKIHQKRASRKKEAFLLRFF